jgi:hypothetical protein
MRDKWYVFKRDRFSQPDSSLLKPSSPLSRTGQFSGLEFFWEGIGGEGTKVAVLLVVVTTWKTSRAKTHSKRNRRRLSSRTAMVLTSGTKLVWSAWTMRRAQTKRALSRTTCRERKYNQDTRERPEQPNCWRNPDRVNFPPKNGLTKGRTHRALSLFEDPSLWAFSSFRRQRGVENNYEGGRE